MYSDLPGRCRVTTPETLTRRTTSSRDGRLDRVLRDASARLNGSPAARVSTWIASGESGNTSWRASVPSSSTASDSTARTAITESTGTTSGRVPGGNGIVKLVAEEWSTSSVPVPRDSTRRTTPRIDTIRPSSADTRVSAESGCAAGTVPRPETVTTAPVMPGPRRVMVARPVISTASPGRSAAREAADAIGNPPVASWTNVRLRSGSFSVTTARSRTGACVVGAL